MPKFYAVKKGFTPGVYSSWSDCQAQTKGFSGAVFKSFATRSEAESFVSHDTPKEEKYDNTVYTDGSFMGSISGGAAVIVESSTVYYASVNGASQSNNRGELYGIILGLLYTKGSVIIHTDSQYSINILANKYTPKENFDLIAEATCLMKGRVVRLEYVPAHVGITFNELADTYAKRACSADLAVRGVVFNESF